MNTVQIRESMDAFETLMIKYINTASPAIKNFDEIVLSTSNNCRLASIKELINEGVIRVEARKTFKRTARTINPSEPAYIVNANVSGIDLFGKHHDPNGRFFALSIPQNSTLDFDYAGFAIDSAAHQLGATCITKERLLSLRILVPPIEKQKLIAKECDKIEKDYYDGIKEKAKRMLEMIDEYHVYCQQCGEEPISTALAEVMAKAVAQNLQIYVEEPC